MSESRKPSVVEITTVATEPCGCDGTGKIHYVEREPEDTHRPLGDGLYAGPATTYGSRLCQCRAELDPRPGEASWWDTTRIYSAEWEASVFRDRAEITVNAERPISSENYIVERRGNRYYPTFVDLDVSDPALHFLFPDEARELARLLIAAADAADAIDKPDQDECGHWWPCDCPKAHSVPADGQEEAAR